MHRRLSFCELDNLESDLQCLPFDETGVGMFARRERILMHLSDAPEIPERLKDVS